MDEAVKTISRPATRFDAALRVDYVYDQRPWLAFSRNLSLGGMLLPPAVHLQVGADINFSICLPASVAPLRVFGRVINMTRRGVHVAFAPLQNGAVTQLRSYAQQAIMPALKAAVAKQDAPLQQICTLANLYADDALTAESMALFRRAYPQRWNHRHFLDNMVAVWVERLLRAPAMEQTALRAELQDICKRATDIASPILAAAGRLLSSPPTPLPVAASGQVSPPPLPTALHISRNQAAAFEQAAILLGFEGDAQRQAARASVAVFQARIRQLEGECEQLKLALAQARGRGKK